MRTILLSIGAILVAAASAAMFNTEPIYANKDFRCVSSENEDGTASRVCSPKEVLSGKQLADDINSCREDEGVDKCSGSQTLFGELHTP